ncbi:hypothetical protein [Saccharopolyspora erythraea]|uniref:hypothetical protein n=1 Tax=Saccharopolyspora erythraea TaxID=1836 RepID=UPI0001D315BF|nr:hypothetical protein [Saccharopolyspora erythraea]EQD84228.1 hypothetical protein N599_21005 [Saccharopolyspora erythraea D]QRK88294.1 hypothetical protein JQX30_26915 [Saccharopolyspora erythraea]
MARARLVTDLAGRVAAEVERQHRLLARWLGTECDSSVIDELRESHSPGFTMTTVEGAALAAEDLFSDLAESRNTTPGLEIAVSDIELVTSSPDLAVVRFRETHRHHGRTTQRRTTAVLRQDPAAPNGFRWQHVHETTIRF